MVSDRVTVHDFRSDPVAVGGSVILWVGLALLGY